MFRLFIFLPAPGYSCDRTIRPGAHIPKYSGFGRYDTHIDQKTATSRKVATLSVLYSYQTLMRSGFEAAVRDAKRNKIRRHKPDIESGIYKSHLQAPVSDYRELIRVASWVPRDLTWSSDWVT